MADVDKAARKPGVEALEAAIASREQARANPYLTLPFGDPRRRRAQRRFDAACEAVTQASLVCHAARLRLPPLADEGRAPDRL
jgi:hypothetical protein